MKILIAEDDMTSRLVLGATLKKLGHEVTATSDGQQAWARLSEEYFPLLISDWMMPDMDGLELCRLIRAANQKQYTYIILLTALGGRNSFLEGLDAGADDFITKPFDEELLAARLRVAERILALHLSLHTQAMYDGLTGLLNRAAIMENLIDELERASRDKRSLGIVLLDLDHFKSVNDNYGHAAGDAVLKEAARRMKNSMRSYDQVGRYGGEEFLIVAPGNLDENVLIMAERVRHGIGSEPIDLGDQMLPISCSLGAAVSSMTVKEDASSLISRADAALYRAKASGRNRTELAGTE
ncbi:MAG TPA: diguanylate cyclase [Abditibacterium sp.]|jgi:two-component system chemotaxis response regulator CheY